MVSATGDSTTVHGRNPPNPLNRDLKRNRNSVQSILDALALSIHPRDQTGGGVPVRVTWHRTVRKATYDKHETRWLSKTFDDCTARPVTRIRVGVTTSSAPLP